ncbi:hypothetical protein FOCC_FOCC002944 [Frankliniella occidentalis]|uniref:Neurofilament heavy polypeptide n=1 Tax=Frankliniella occidentalis TaxID=133901 RepID=A0A6J1SGV0_FRAOC|nr:neurofilament heavy polypeptide [Frankliniella occidentalis]KAE8750385.1 hypothetical protein FOCC_FOCC002944 [Frankliniella occidentalis]
MSAPAVKPVLSAPAAGGQAPTPTATSPLKNHSGSPNLSITLVNDKTPEKPKDAVSSNASPKSTPNGVEAAKSGSPLVNDKKSDDSNHITSTTATTLPVNNVTQITASPLKATPEKTQPANNTPPASANNTTPKSPAPTTTPGPTATAGSAPPPAVGSITPVASDKQATPTKANSTPSDDKEKPTTASPTTPKRGAEKTDKQEKDKEKAGTASRIKRKRETAPPSTPSSEDADSKGSKRTRVPVQPYQSPMPDLFPTKVKTPAKPPVVKEKEKDTDKEKLVIFYKNEFLAVRNSEGSFYVCQAMQNVYKSSHKIKIRWLSQVEGEKSDDGTVYSPDFYDSTDFDCILTSLSLKRVDKSKFNLSTDETLRTENILKRALDVEKGVSEKPELTEEHPDGLDLSLFKDEAQLKKRKSQGKRASGSPKRARRSQTPVKKEEKPKVEKKKPVASPKRFQPRMTPGKGAPPRFGGRKARSVSVGKTPRKDKEDKPEKIEKQTAQTRAERASEREKAKESTPASKTPAKRKAESPVPVVETKAPKTTARTAASAKKAAAEAKAAAQAAIAAQAATASAPPAGRKPPARGRRGLGNAESAEPEVAAPQNRATKRNVRSSSPADTEKKESNEATKEEVEAKSAEAADAPASTTSATNETTPATTSPVVPAVAPPATPAAAPADSAAAPSEQKVQAPAETATSAASTESTTASEAKSPSSDASPNRGAPKKSTTPSPPKKA